MSISDTLGVASYHTGGDQVLSKDTEQYTQVLSSTRSL